MKRIPVYPNVFVQVDDEDFERFAKFAWHLDRNGYVRRTTGSGHQWLHREILPGSSPAKLVDHADGDRLNCQRQNLRYATRSQNAMNWRPRSARLSQFKGVTKHRGRWQAQICVKSRRIYLGMFDTDVEAARAYDAAAVMHFGEFAAPNFPGGAS